MGKGMEHKREQSRAMMQALELVKGTFRDKAMLNSEEIKCFLCCSLLGMLPKVIEVAGNEAK